MVPHGPKMVAKESSITSSFRTWRGGRIVLDVYVQESKSSAQASLPLSSFPLTSLWWVLSHMTSPVCKGGWRIGEHSFLWQGCILQNKTKIVSINPLSSRKCLLYWFLACFYNAQTLKKGSTDQEKIEFLKEAHLMRYQGSSKIIFPWYG